MVRDLSLDTSGVKVIKFRGKEYNVICRIDPFGEELRTRGVLHSWRYHVETPNSMCHLDGYHKLIHWNIVIHGGIDGYI